MEWREILYKSSPEYVRAYQDGYDQAKYEMLQMIESIRELVETMTPLSETSSTASSQKKEIEGEK